MAKGDKMQQLTAEDVGKVFLRRNGPDRGAYLLLWSIAGDPPPCPSFITFRLERGEIVDVADTGHGPGGWYDPVDSIPPDTIDEVKRRHEMFVAERLRELREATAAAEALRIPLPQSNKERSICPVCFNGFPLAEAYSAYPTCPACMSDAAIEIPLKPFEVFLNAHSLAEFRGLLAKWSTAKGFSESYKQEKRGRIEAVIAAKIAAEPQERE